MPCYIKNMVDVAFKAKNRSLLFGALDREKFKYFIYKENEIVIKTPAGRMALSIMLKEGIAKFDANDQSAVKLLNDLKLAYGRQVLLMGALMKRWTLGKEKLPNTNEEVFTLSRPAGTAS